MDLDITLTAKQQMFIDATQSEVLYGGAAGGGKSYGQVVDSLLYALQYQGSKQLILRRTFPELRRSLILTSIEIFPQRIATYNQSNHVWNIAGGSTIEFGYCDSETSVSQYQSAEYDVIRFDELTHFTEYQYTYMISRNRGANPFPKQIKSSTNPSGIGHGWVKARFIDDHDPMVGWMDENHRTRIFIPALVQENRFLMEADPEYINRLEQLPENEKRALLYGDWDIFEGQFFTEFRDNPQGYITRRFSHVVEPFEIPYTWHRYRIMDWGYAKPFSVQWWAVNQDDQAFMYREWYGCTDKADTGLKLTPTQVATHIKEIEKQLEPAGVYIQGVADPAIWGSDTGESVYESFAKAGVLFQPADNKRLNGWMQVRERMKFDEEGFARLYIFRTCRAAIRTIPSQVYDDKKPEDLDTTGEDHISDAMRYFCMARPAKPRLPKERKVPQFDPLQTEKKVISGLGFLRS